MVPDVSALFSTIYSFSAASSRGPVGSVSVSAPVPSTVTSSGAASSPRQYSPLISAEIVYVPSVMPASGMDDTSHRISSVRESPSGVTALIRAGSMSSSDSRVAGFSPPAPGTVSIHLPSAFCRTPSSSIQPQSEISASPAPSRSSDTPDPSDATDVAISSGSGAVSVSCTSSGSKAVSVPCTSSGSVPAFSPSEFLISPLASALPPDATS